LREAREVNELENKKKNRTSNIGTLFAPTIVPAEIASSSVMPTVAICGSVKIVRGTTR
jgi:hypothetical protein